MLSSVRTGWKGWDVAVSTEGPCSLASGCRLLAVASTDHSEPSGGFCLEPKKHLAARGSHQRRRKKPEQVNKCCPAFCVQGGHRWWVMKHVREMDEDTEVRGGPGRSSTHPVSPWQVELSKVTPSLLPVLSSRLCQAQVGDTCPHQGAFALLSWLRFSFRQP